MHNNLTLEYGKQVGVNSSLKSQDGQKKREGRAVFFSIRIKLSGFCEDVLFTPPSILESVYS